MAQENEGIILLRNVWAYNLINECNHIKDSVESYSFASIKCKSLHFITEFADNITQETPELVYDFMKLHIGNIPIVQLGMTLFNSNQELPVIEGHPTIWLFHFSTSDSHYCPKTLSEASLDMLDLRSVDFERNQKEGVDPAIFGYVMIQLGCLQKINTWISFVTMYDFGYMVKLLMGKNCYPETLEEFLEKTKSLMSEVLYDVKDMAKLVGLGGSFKQVTEAIGVVGFEEDEEGNAAFDSHFTMQVFMNLKTRDEFRDGIWSIIDLLDMLWTLWFDY